MLDDEITGRLTKCIMTCPFGIIGEPPHAIYARCITSAAFSPLGNWLFEIGCQSKTHRLDALKEWSGGER